MILVLPDDAQREYGSARGLSDTKVGALTPALDAEAKKCDWKRVFKFD
jgi:hypothetical protein